MAPHTDSPPAGWHGGCPGPVSCVRRDSALVGCLFFHVFLTNIRDLSGLGIFSIFADFANLLAYSVVFWFDGSTIEDNGLQGKALSFSGIPFALGVGIYCYEGAGLIISLEASVPKERRDEFPRIFKLALCAITILYLIFGIFGYVSYGNDTEKIITLNLPKGIFPNIVKACLCFSVRLCCACLGCSCRGGCTTVLYFDA